MIKGDFKMVDAKGNEIRVADTTYLCRCGHSKNKPFCDGMHKEIDFKE
jgi:CDGSH-type Zn-finger protein